MWTREMNKLMISGGMRDREVMKEVSKSGSDVIRGIRKWYVIVTRQKLVFIILIHGILEYGKICLYNIK